jgi:outer membrane protein
MRKIFLLVFILSCFALVSHAQMVFVDTKYILNKMPDYRDSLAKLNQLTLIWQREIDDKQAILDKMYVDFQRDEPMLSDDLKKQRTDNIFIHEKEVRDLQRMRFGFEGDLFKKRQELIKPLEEKVDTAIQAVAFRQKYTMVLDKSEGITVMFSKPDLEITDDVMKELGMK